MRKYLTEFFGTFFLVLTIGLAVGARTPFAPVAIGAILMAMVYMGKHISGAHYNPAITLAVFIRRKIELKDAGFYVLAQILGALGAAGVVGLLVQDADFTFLIAREGAATQIQAFLFEILFSFALTLVFFHVMEAKQNKGNSHYGLSIGFTVMVGAIIGGPISLAGGAFNPAIGFAPNILNAGYTDLWIYTVGPFLGAVMAAFAFNYQTEGKV